MVKDRYIEGKSNEKNSEAIKGGHFSKHISIVSQLENSRRKEDKDSRNEVGFKKKKTMKKIKDLSGTEVNRFPVDYSYFSVEIKKMVNSRKKNSQSSEEKFSEEALRSREENAIENNEDEIKYEDEINNEDVMNVGDSEATTVLYEDDLGANQSFFDSEEEPIVVGSEYPDYEDVYEERDQIFSSNSKSLQDYRKQNSSRERSPTGFRIPMAKPLNDYQDEKRSERRRKKEKKLTDKAPDWVDESVSRNVADVTNRHVASTDDLAFGGNVLLDAIGGRRRTDHRRMTGALPDDATSTLGTNRRLTNDPAHTGGLRKDDVSSEKLQSSNRDAYEDREARSETVLQGASGATLGTMNPATKERTRDVSGDFVRPDIAAGGKGAREGLARRSVKKNGEAKKKKIDYVTSQVNEEEQIASDIRSSSESEDDSEIVADPTWLRLSDFSQFGLSF